MLTENYITVWSVRLFLLSVLVPRYLCARPEFSNPDGTVREYPALEELVSSWDYPINILSVTTEDGYLLTLFRLPQDDPTASSVYIQHGILSSSATFLANRRGLAYELHNKGYDVWVGNARGTQFSREHNELSAYSEKYWDFSFHEMGYYDIPAVLRFIRHKTGKPQVHYVGHSMGCTMFLVTATCRPELLELVHTVTFLAPVARPEHMEMISGPVKRTLFNLGMKILPRFGMSNYNYKPWVGPILQRYCSSNGWIADFCRSNITGKEAEYDYKNAKDVWWWFYDGTSLKNHQHYIQIADAGRFQQFDYGAIENMKRYKNRTPPEYILENIQKRIYLLCGGKDNIAQREDVIWLHSRLKGSWLVTDQFEHFDHSTFNTGVEIELVHETVEAIIKASEENTDPHFFQETPLS